MASHEPSPTLSPTYRAAAWKLNDDGGVAHTSDSARSKVLANSSRPAVAAPKIRRLIGGQRYFGLDAVALHAGAARVLERLAVQAPQELRLDIRTLAQDFRLDSAAASTLLTALLVGGLLQRQGASGYRPTQRFREYAAAQVVKPLSRDRAKALVARASQLAAQINTDWTKNPFQIQQLAVSGSYMSRCDPLPELSVSLVLAKRAQVRGRRWRSSLPQEIALRQMAGAMKALSSFIVVHLTTDVQAIRRPFTFVYNANEDLLDDPMPAWGKLREWSASISRRLAR